MQNNYYQEHAKEQGGVDKEEKTMKHHYSKSQRSLQRAFIQKSNKNQSLKTEKGIIQKEGSYENRDPTTDGWSLRIGTNDADTLLLDSNVPHASPAIPS